MLIPTYLRHQVLKSCFNATALLLLVGLSNRWVTYLPKVTAGTLPFSWILWITALSIPDLLVYTLPLGFFLGSLLVLGRLQADSELIVMRFNWAHRHFIMAFWTWGFAMSLVTLCCAHLLSPLATQQREHVLLQGRQIALFEALPSGRFQLTDGGRKVFLALQKDPSSPYALERVFIASFSPSATKPTLMFAKKAHVVEILPGAEPNTTTPFLLQLEEGQRLRWDRPEAVERTQFETYQKAIPIESPLHPTDALKSKSFSDLWFLEDLPARIEWWYRTWVGWSPLLLASLIWPLVVRMGNPRQGRFAHLPLGIAVYLGEQQLLLLGRNLLLKCPWGPSWGGSALLGGWLLLASLLGRRLP